MTEGAIPPAPAAAHRPTRAEAAASARRAAVEVAAIQLCGAIALLLPRFRADRPEPLLGVLLSAVLLLWLAVAVAAAHQLVERGTSARVLLLIAVVLLGAGAALAVDAAVRPGTSLALWLLVAGLPGVPLGTALSRAAARAVAPSTDAPGRWRPSPATRRALAECWALLLAGSGAALLLGAGEVKALWIVPAVLVVCAAWLALARLARRAAGLRGTGGRATALVLLVVAAAVAAIAAGAATGDAFWHLGGSLLGAVLLAALVPAAIVGALRAGAAARG